MVVTPYQQAAIRVGFLVLIVFAILRPLSLMGANVVFAGISIIEVMGVGVSYLLVLPFLAGLKQFKLDRLAWLSLLFCLYAAESIAWGSEIRRVTQTILPFLLLFTTRMFITESNQMKTLLPVIVIAFVIPIAVSTYNVALGRSIEMIEWRSQVPRHAGVFAGSHVLAYTMLFYSYFYCILRHVYQFNTFILRFVISFFLVLSSYCLYQSHTRTALIGFIIFWFIYLWGNNKKFFYAALILSIFIGIIFQSQIYMLIFKQAEIDLQVATSGRISLWTGNIQEFIDSSLPRQLLGQGLGYETRFGFHNDFLRLLMSLGAIGLVLYLILLFSLLWDIYLCSDKKTKYLFGAILISSTVMSFGSNAVVFRIELSQFFWLIMGMFFLIPKLKNGECDTK